MPILWFYRRNVWPGRVTELGYEGENGAVIDSEHAKSIEIALISMSTKVREPRIDHTNGCVFVLIL